MEVRFERAANTSVAWQQNRLNYYYCPKKKCKNLELYRRRNKQCGIHASFRSQSQSSRSLTTSAAILLSQLEFCLFCDSPPIYKWICLTPHAIRWKNSVTLSTEWLILRWWHNYLEIKVYFSNEYTAHIHTHTRLLQIPHLRALAHRRKNPQRI